jgi:hypothetical protein
VIAGDYHIATAPVVVVDFWTDAELRTGSYLGGAAKAPVAKSHVIVVLFPPVDLDGKSPGLPGRYSVPSGPVDFVPGRRPLVEVPGLTDPKAKEIVAAIQRAARDEKATDPKAKPGASGEPSPKSAGG